MSNTPSAPDPYTPPPATRAEAARAGYAAPAAEYAAPPAPAGTPRGSRTLGLVAFFVAVAATVVGAILAVLTGIQTGRLAEYSGMTELDPANLPPAVEQISATASLLGIATFAVWGLLALWAIVQGIVAAVKNRGRGWGIGAIVLAIVGGGIVFVCLGIGVGIGAAPFV